MIEIEKKRDLTPASFKEGHYFTGEGVKWLKETIDDLLRINVAI